MKDTFKIGIKLIFFSLILTVIFYVLGFGIKSEKRSVLNPKQYQTIQSKDLTVVVVEDKAIVTKFKKFDVIMDTITFNNNKTYNFYLVEKVK